ncbi:MAG: hypothetical protein H6807_08975 [Planctomycetes bacterium]|nr:hypothetical protein [Planctomycetota bacterium]
MASEQLDSDTRNTLWKGMAVFMGLMLLLALVAWTRDRARLRGARHHAEARAQTLESELGARAEAASEPHAVDHDEAAATAAIEFDALREDYEARLALKLQELRALEAELAEERSNQAAEREAQELERNRLARIADEAEKAAGRQRARIARLEEHCEALMGRERRLLAERESVAAASEDRSEAEGAALRARLAELEGALAHAEDAAREQHEALSRAIAIAEENGAARERAEAQIRTDHEQLARLEEKLASREDRFRKMSEQNEVMRQATLEAEGHAVALSREVDRLKAETRALVATAAARPEPKPEPGLDGDERAELRILRAESATNQREIDRLRREIDALEAALTRARAQR